MHYKPLGKKCNLNSTNLKRLNTRNKLAENLGKKEGKIVKYRIVKRGKTIGIEQNNVQSSETAPSTRRANINERDARLLGAIPELEGDNIDMDEDHIKLHFQQYFSYIMVVSFIGGGNQRPVASH
jgi:DNA-directed RNA polymerase subunit H (RpoH/RPB5)